MFATLPTATTDRPLFTLETTAPRAAAMAYARHLVRVQGVRLSTINYRRAADGVITITAPGCLGMRFPHPPHDQR